MEKKKHGEPNIPAEAKAPANRIKIRIRSGVWRGARLAQRRRAGLVAFPEWGEHEVSADTLALLELDQMIEVERL